MNGNQPGTNGGWRGVFPPALWAKLQSKAEVRTFEAGEIIQDVGDPMPALLKVTAGHVKLMLVDENGAAETVDMLAKGDIFSEAALAGETTYENRAIAMDQVRLLCVPSDAIFTELMADPENALAALGILSTNLRRLLGQVTELKLKNTSQRLGMLLIRLASESYGRARIELPYRKQDVADKLAMSPESLSRSFGKLEKVGVSTEGHRVVLIQDLEELADFCGINIQEEEAVQ